MSFDRQGTAQRLLVVVAHPDDETFGCGSLLAMAADRGIPAWVACATRGEAGKSADGRLSGDELAAAREIELRTAASLLGVDHVELFDWGDSDMEGEPAPGTLCAAPLDEVAAAVGDLIDRFEPTVVVSIDGSDGHRDHKYIGAATMLAAGRSRWRSDRVYLSCLPRALVQTWLDRLRAEQPDSPYLGLGEVGVPDDAITTEVDTSAYYDLRERAIAAHATQVSPYELMPADVRRDFLSRDFLQRVYPSWTGGPRETDIFGAA